MKYVNSGFLEVKEERVFSRKLKYIWGKVCLTEISSKSLKECKIQTSLKWDIEEALKSKYYEDLIYLKIKRFKDLKIPIFKVPKI